jgi:hypothetical protein
MRGGATPLAADEFRLTISEFCHELKSPKTGDLTGNES